MLPNECQCFKMADVDGPEPTNGMQNEEYLDVKKATVTNRLQKRDEERVADLVRRKEEKENAAAENESLDFFLSKFAEAKNEVDSLLSNARGLEKSMISPHFDEVQIAFRNLQKFTADNNLFLSAYELQKAQDTINKLQADITQTREELLPKKKFSFGSKKKAAAGDKSAKPVIKAEKKMKEIMITDCSFADMSGQMLKKDAAEVNGKDVALARLTDSTIKLTGTPGTLVMDNLTNCRVFCGPVPGSIFIDGCKDCTFVLACQQLRIHTTTNSRSGR